MYIGTDIKTDTRVIVTEWTIQWLTRECRFMYLFTGQGGGGSAVYIGTDIKTDTTVIVTEWTIQWLTRECRFMYLFSGQGGGGSAVYIGTDIKTDTTVIVTEWTIQWRTVAKRRGQVKVTELDEDREGLEHLKQVPSCQYIICSDIT